jgi:hypothetical protein
MRTAEEFSQLKGCIMALRVGVTSESRAELESSCCSA